MKAIKIIEVLIIVGILIAFALLGGNELIGRILAPKNIYMVEYKDSVLKKTFKLQRIEAIRISEKPEHKENIFLGIAESQNGDKYSFHLFDKNYILIHTQNHAIYTLSEKSIQALTPFLNEREMYIKKLEEEYKSQNTTASVSDPNGPYEKHPGNMITKSKAEELAIAEFERNGIRQEDYVVSVAADNTGKKWLVSFEKKGKYPLPGEKHLVTVEKDGGKAVFMRGE